MPVEQITKHKKNAWFLSQVHSNPVYSYTVYVALYKYVQWGVKPRVLLQLVKHEYGCDPGGSLTGGSQIVWCSCPGAYALQLKIHLAEACSQVTSILQY